MANPKENYNRKYPDANHQPCHKAAERVGKAEARQEAYDALTLQQKIAQLPPEPYSKKQRARLLVLLEKQNNKAPAVKEAAPKPEVADKPKTKKYMKGQ